MGMPRLRLQVQRVGTRVAVLMRSARREIARRLQQEAYGIEAGSVVRVRLDQSVMEGWY